MFSSSFRRYAYNAIRNKNVLPLGKCYPQVSASCLSTNPQLVDHTLVIPPNLKIDPRTKTSPYYGIETLNIQDEAKTDTTDEMSVCENPNEVHKLDDVPINETMYSPNSRPEQVFAIPLPQRLHVSIIHFAKNEKSGSIHLSPEVFGQDPIRTDILHRCVVYQRNKLRGKRNGGARTKTISEVSGSGKKMRNQKGGGVARAGHKRPAHWRGGAKAHGPKGSVQDYETKLNKKVRKMGIRMALSQKLKEGNLILVDSFSDLGTYKTKVLSKMLHELAGVGSVDGKSGYIVDHVLDEVNENDEDAIATSLSGVDINLKVASGNIFRCKVTNQRNVNVYDLLKHEKLILSLSALEKLEERYGDSS
jgi:large subunit ribosomal protein L4